jgi:hypothetical protein
MLMKHLIMGENHTNKAMKHFVPMKIKAVKQKSS